MDWGRFTACGGPAAERAVADAVQDAAEAMKRVMDPSRYVSVVLIGGYGRGEGGVDRTGGGERPHNNLDFLVIARSGRGLDGLKSALDAELAPVASRHGIGMDVGIVTASRLEASPCSVMWYDMRHGHKTVLGDPDFVASLEGFRLDAIPPSDVRDLLVNRVTLLVVDDAVMESGPLDPGDPRFNAVVRHAVKAVIGVGDAWLFFRDAYHWSYVERRDRMRSARDAPPDLADLYEWAMAFRFEPDYDRIASMDVRSLMERVRGCAARTHLEVEAARLARPGLSWAGYPEAALAGILSERPSGPRDVVRRLANLAGLRSCPLDVGAVARIGWMLASGRDMMALALPGTAYGPLDPVVGDLARAALRVRARDQSDLRRAYLAAWAEHGDPNFRAAARRLGLSLDGGPR